MGAQLRLQILTYADNARRASSAASEVVLNGSRFTFECEGPEDHGRMMAALVEDEERNQRIVGQVLAEARAGHTVLVLSGRVAHCQHLAARIAGQGIRAHALIGGTDKAERSAHLEAFRAGRLPVLVASTVADEGLDVPRLGRLVHVLAYPGPGSWPPHPAPGAAYAPAPGLRTPPSSTTWWTCSCRRSSASGTSAAASIARSPARCPRRSPSPAGSRLLFPGTRA